MTPIFFVGRPDQLKDEFLKVVDKTFFIIFKALDFQNFEDQISPARSQQIAKNTLAVTKLGKQAEQAISRSLRRKESETQKLLTGEAAFYGPNTGLHVQRRHRKTLAVGNHNRWITIFPNVSNWNYIGSDNKQTPPGDDTPCTFWLHGTFCGSTN
jgi:threonyl-tRNA synthetase